MLDISPLVSIGLHNPRIKQYLTIKHSTKAHPENLACIEGLRALSCALKARLRICSFFICPDLLRGEGKLLAEKIITSGAPTFLVAEKVLRHMVDWEGPDGLAAIVQLARFDLQNILLRAHNVVLVLDGVQKPGNIGTIIRSADGAGADGIIMTNSQQRVAHPKLIRASMGSLFSLPIIEAEMGEAIAWLQRSGFKIVTTDTAAALNYRQANYQGRVAIIMGNENHGIHKAWYQAQYASVSIPMNGRADSLNVANAAVLMLYEVYHQQLQARCL